jgi:hypothetical protein
VKYKNERLGNKGIHAKLNFLKIKRKIINVDVFYYLQLTSLKKEVGVSSLGSRSTPIFSSTFLNALASLV